MIMLTWMVLQVRVGTLDPTARVLKMKKKTLSLVSGILNPPQKRRKMSLRDARFPVRKDVVGPKNVSKSIRIYPVLVP